MRDDGGVPYPIPAGASDHRLGGLGFANWADEVAAKIDETRAQVAKIARNTAELIGLERPLADDEITVLAAGPATTTASRSTRPGGDPAHRPLEGVIIDPVYEGKSMAGLIDLVTSGEIGKDSNVLYAHLGGQPALNAYSALFRN